MIAAYHDWFAAMFAQFTPIYNARRKQDPKGDIQKAFDYEP